MQANAQVQVCSINYLIIMRLSFRLKLRGRYFTKIKGGMKMHDRLGEISTEPKYVITSVIY